MDTSNFDWGTLHNTHIIVKSHKCFPVKIPQGAIFTLNVLPDPVRAPSGGLLFAAVCLQFYAQISNVTFCLKSFCTIVMIIAKSLLLKVALLSTIKLNKKAL